MGKYVSANPFIPHSDEEIEEMMQAIGIDSIDELFKDVPGELLSFSEPDFEGPLSEQETLRRIEGMASKNRAMPDLQINIGGGIYPRYTPAVVAEILRRSEFLTAYTPYQPEVSQGVLMALFEYQSLMAELLGLEVVNSSMYDWSTALGEAVRMAMRITGKRKVLVGRYIFWERVETLKTYVEPIGGVVEEIGFTDRGELDIDMLEAKLNGAAALYVENPCTLGFIVSNLDEVADVVHTSGALLILGVEPTSLAILKSPGEYGADIAVGEGQCLGLEMGFGGPGLGILACKGEQHLIRAMPGRLIGMTTTVDGLRRCFSMVLQTREQHIKREKATSNICTNQTLMAIGAAAYLALLGRDGLRSLAEYNMAITRAAIDILGVIDGVEIPFKDLPHYNEFAYRVKNRTAKAILHKLLERGIAGGIDVSKRFPELGEAIVTCFTEVHNLESIRRYASALKEA